MFFTRETQRNQHVHEADDRETALATGLHMTGVDIERT
jgi:hypothetical protein